MSKSATEQFQIKKKRKHPLSVNTTTPLNKSNKRYVLSVTPTPDLLIKENYSEFQIDDKESKFNSLLQIKSIAGTAATANAAAAVYKFSDSKKCITTSTTNNTVTTTSAVVAAAALGATRTNNCLRDRSNAGITPRHYATLTRILCQGGFGQQTRPQVFENEWCLGLFLDITAVS